jgi:predicted nucleotidyltransferase
MRLRQAEQAALAQLATWLRRELAGRLRELVLFGSRARGEGDDDSDLDVLVVVDDLAEGEARAIAHACGDLLTQHDVIVSPLVLSTERIAELRRRERLIAREIDRDGVSL